MMEFEVNMVYQKEDIAAVQRGTAIRRYRGKPLKRAMRFLGTFFLTYILASILFSFFSVVLEDVIVILDGAGILSRAQSTAVLSFIICGGSLALTIYDQWGNRQRFLSRLMWRKVRKGKRERIQFRFTEEEFCVHMDESDVRNRYSIIEEVLESPTHYLLFINQNTAYVLNKENFLEGDPAAFGAWLAEKLGKEIREIR